MTRFEDAVARLGARQPEHMPGPSLDRIRLLADYLDEPQLTYPTIHVTGTNGKTTAARVAASVACAQGITAGVFTSPHLLSVTERFSVCGLDMAPQEFADEWAHLEPYLELVDGAGHGEVTYFEAVTGLAYLWFADRPVALGVFEVGMGGSWDATNLVAGDVAVITPIGMDHVAELGPTLADIAGEKAGILKPGKTGVIRAQDAEAALVLARRADEVGAHLLHEGVDWEVEERLLAVGGQSFRLRGAHGTYEDLFLPMFGDYAVHNAAAGVVAYEVLTGQALDEDTLREGLAAVRSPGRLEVVGREPLLLLDGAHNPAGSEALAETLPSSFTWERLHVVLAVSANKDVAGVVAPLAALADVVYATRNDSVRSAEPEVVAEAAKAAGAVDVRVEPSLRDAIDAARAAAGAVDAIVVTGSLFTVGDAKRVLG
ncbi:MAG: bifunctional folylpolyglutamate synthase/dihydrofolate synthase [Actinomycetota bacterium]